MINFTSCGDSTLISLRDKKKQESNEENMRRELRQGGSSQILRDVLSLGCTYEKLDGETHLSLSRMPSIALF